MNGKDHRDFLQVYRGNPKDVNKRLLMEMIAVIGAWFILAWASPVSADNVDIVAMTIGPMLMFLWAWIRLAAVSFVPCNICQGIHNRRDDPSCAGCSMNVETPSRFERYEPRSRKEVGWWWLGYIPKSARAEWKDGRWKR